MINRLLSTYILYFFDKIKINVFNVTLLVLAIYTAALETTGVT